MMTQEKDNATYNSFMVRIRNVGANLENFAINHSSLLISGGVLLPLVGATAPFYAASHGTAASLGAIFGGIGGGSLAAGVSYGEVDPAHDPADKKFMAFSSLFLGTVAAGLFGFLNWSTYPDIDYSNELEKLRPIEEVVDERNKASLVSYGVCARLDEANPHKTQFPAYIETSEGDMQTVRVDCTQVEPLSTTVIATPEDQAMLAQSFCSAHNAVPERFALNTGDTLRLESGNTTIILENVTCEGNGEQLQERLERYAPQAGV